MPFATNDPNMLDDWLVVGPAPAPSASRTTRLLGETVQLSTGADYRESPRRPIHGTDP